MEALLIEVFSSPAFKVLMEQVGVPLLKPLFEDMASRIISDIFSHRTSDPEFLAKSDAVFAQLSAAKTDQEKIDAQNALRNLMSGK